MARVASWPSSLPGNGISATATNVAKWKRPEPSYADLALQRLRQLSTPNSLHPDQKCARYSKPISCVDNPFDM